MVGTRVEQAAPARRMAVGGAGVALAMELRMERSMGLSAETLQLREGETASDASRALTIGGALGAVVLGGRNRAVAAVSRCGAPRRLASARASPSSKLARQSARDPRYTVIPQRERLKRRAEASRSRLGDGARARAACAGPRPRVR